MAITSKLISIKRVLEKVYRDYHFNTEVVWADVIEWVAEAINYLGVAPAYEDKVSKRITLENGRGELPCDLMYIKMVRNYDTQEVLVRSFDQFHLSNFFRCEEEAVSTEDDFCSPLHTYTTNGNYIFTSATSGDIEIAYKAMPTDEQGLPMIPDDDKYIRAMAAYVAERIAFKLVMQNKLAPALLDKIEQERHWAFGSAKMKAIIPDIDGMEAWKNSFLRLIPTINSHGRAFKYDAQPQQQTNYNSH